MGRRGRRLKVGRYRKCAGPSRGATRPVVMTTPAGGYMVPEAMKVARLNVPPRARVGDQVAALEALVLEDAVMRLDAETVDRFVRGATGLDARRLGPSDARY